jgi:hypothetical protein
MGSLRKIKYTINHNIASKFTYVKHNFQKKKSCIIDFNSTQILIMMKEEKKFNSSQIHQSKNRTGHKTQT